MKRKTVFIALALSLVLVFGALQAAFAGFDINGTAADGNEYAIETAALKLADDTAAGGYKVAGTDKVSGWVQAGKEMLVIDTMPACSFAAHRVKGAINVECGDDGPNGEFTTEQQKALLAEVKAFSGTKTVRYYWSSKSKKWVTKKPAAKYWTKCTKKSDKYYGKKVKDVVKDVKNKLIVVYCGFTKCRRSHAAAAYLVSKGYTKVYRYPGGISAWGDARDAASDPELFPIEGTDAGEPETPPEG